MSATVRWSCLSWDRIRPAVASVMRGFMPHPVDERKEGRLGILGAGAREQLGQRGVAEDLTGPDEQEPVATSGLVHDVARDEHRATLLGEPSEEVPEVAAQHRVQADGRLVEDEHLGIADQGAGQIGPGLLAAGEVDDERLRVVGEVDIGDGAGHIRLGGAQHPSEVGDVLADGEVLIEAWRLREVADPTAQPGRPGRLPRIVMVPPATTLTPTRERIRVDLPPHWAPAGRPP